MTSGESSRSGKAPGRLKGMDPAFAAPHLTYKAFISYKQKADGVLAKAMETGLEQFSKKWYQRRAFDVFRDATSLGPTRGSGRPCRVPSRRRSSTSSWPRPTRLRPPGCATS